MVFLRTTVTRSPQDVERMMQDERARTPNIQRFKKDLEEQDAGKREDEE